MKCPLGSKKVRKCEAITGNKYSAAFVRGGWGHRWAECWREDSRKEENGRNIYTRSEWVNYLTGEFEE